MTSVTEGERCTLPTCILVHPVGVACDNSCKYCFHRNAKKTDPSQRMESEIFLDFYAHWMNVIPDHAECEIIWHGGEPTLRGIAFYEEVLRESAAITPASKIVRHCIQTNGLGIDHDWAALFKKYGVLVGLSIDGPPDAHDALRVRRNGAGTFDRCIKAYRLLAEHGLSVGVVTVVNKHNVGRARELFGSFKEHGITRLQLSPCLELSDEEDDYSITAREFADFACTLYDCWVSEDQPEISIGFISDIVDDLLGRPHYNCMLNDKCHNFAVLHWDGEISTCDGMRNRQQRMGSRAIDAPSFDEEWSVFHRRVSAARFEQCHACEWYGTCHGGCPYHWPEQGPEKTALCEAHQAVCRHIATSIRSIYCRTTSAQHHDSTLTPLAPIS